MPNRRERNRGRTRDALVDAAMHLFATQGYGRTTVEEITELADVSPRTFFRYFSAKEEVLFQREDTHIPVELIASQPPRLSDLDAVRAALVEIAPLIHPMRERLRLLRRALASAPTLRGRDFDQRKLGEEHIALGLARRRSLKVPDRRAILAGAVAFATFRMAMDQWLDAGDHRSLAPLVAAEFDRLQVIGAAASADGRGGRAS